MKKYRRIEITALRRRVMITSGGTNTDDAGAQSPPVEEGVWLNDADSGEAIEVESDAGQLILADAVRSLEKRVSIAARGACRCNTIATDPPLRFSRSFYSKLRWLSHNLIHPKSSRFTRKEK